MLLLSQSTYHNHFVGKQLSPTLTQLRTYSGETLEVLGELEVTVQYQEQQARVPLLVVQGEGPGLFGRNWLLVIRI